MHFKDAILDAMSSTADTDPRRTLKMEISS